MRRWLTVVTSRQRMTTVTLVVRLTMAERTSSIATTSFQARLYLWCGFIRRNCEPHHTQSASHRTPGCDRPRHQAKPSSPLALMMAEDHATSDEYIPPKIAKREPYLSPEKRSSDQHRRVVEEPSLAIPKNQAYMWQIDAF